MTRLCSIAILVMASASSMEAFSTNGHFQTWSRPRRRLVDPTRTSSTSSTSQLSMYTAHEEGTSMLSLLLSSTSFVLPPNLLTSTPTALMADPTIEAEVLNDMSHIALDMVSFIGPATAALRLFAVIGRVLAMSADYVPDHSMLGDEFLFQIVMLVIACRGFFKSAGPLLAASCHSNFTVRDGRTYQALFKPAGISWLQYKTLMASAMDYVEVEPLRIITTEERNNTNDDHNYMYWLYSGNVKVLSQGKIIQTIARKGTSPRLDEANFMALLGGMRLVKKLDEKKNRNDMSSKPKKSSNVNQYPNTTIQAGESGATLLRIDTSCLVKLMDNDEQLSQSIRSLLVTEMQEKLSAMLTSSSQQSNGTVSFLQATL